MKQQEKVNTSGDLEVIWVSGEADGVVQAAVSNAFLSCDSSLPVLLTGRLQVVWGIRIWLPLRNEGQAGQRQGVQVVSHVWCLEGGAGWQWEVTLSVWRGWSRGRSFLKRRDFGEMDGRILHK